MDPLTSSGLPKETLTFLASFDVFRDLDETTLRSVEQACEPVQLDAGEVLYRPGDPGDCLHLIIRGHLQVLTTRTNGHEQVLADLAGGDCLGEMTLLTGQSRSSTVRAVQPSELLKWPKAAFDRLSDRYPAVKTRLQQLASRRQSSRYLALMELFRGVDRPVLEEFIKETNWIRLPGGETLFREGDAADCLYAVVHGRLQAFIQSTSAERPIVRHIGRGTCVGETSLLTDEPRSATVRAARDSELVRLPKAAFTRLLERYPQAGMELARTLARRLRQSTSASAVVQSVTTIAVVPGHKAVTRTRFAESLAQALTKCDGTALHLNSRLIDRHLGEGAARTPLNSLGNSRIVNWLNDQEDRHRYILYECDPEVSTWTQRCLRQADLVLIVHPAEFAPAPGEIEAGMRAGELSSGGRRELVLLHQESTRQPTGTMQWLQACRVEAHHHVRADRGADYERLARLITGRATSLVLSGGGARGFAHIGVIRAMHECGLPIDLVGGTSMGAIIAGQYAMGLDPAQTVAVNRKGFVGIAPHRDKTIPIIALITGRKLTRMLKMMFGQTQIEDLWLKFFCVSANLTRAQTMVHQQGPLWLWTRASVAVPGAIPPVVLQNGDLLVDGGILNNLPADVVGTLAQGSVIAVDVCARTDLSTNVGARSSFSGWKLLWGRLNPFAKRVSVPNIFNVLTRATMLNTLSKIDTVKLQADLYIHVPTDEIGLFDWKSIDRAVEIGYRFAIEQLEQWKKEQTA
jgi:predicted acylesterase/phospholipase RssA/CRP-like cAMP-binding protein